MADTQRAEVPLQNGDSPAPVDWRRILLILGFFVLLAALFVGGATQAGIASRLIAVAGLAMIAISVVASIAKHFASAKGKG